MLIRRSIKRLWLKLYQVQLEFCSWALWYVKCQVRMQDRVHDRMQDRMQVRMQVRMQDRYRIGCRL